MGERIKLLEKEVEILIRKNNALKDEVALLRDKNEMLQKQLDEAHVDVKEHMSIIERLKKDRNEAYHCIRDQSIKIAELQKQLKEAETPTFYMQQVEMTDEEVQRLHSKPLKIIFTREV